jgi:ABC-type uncharacterized transport system permease subunit
MTQEQINQVITGMDMILTATGSTVTMSSLIKQQEALLAKVPAEQHVSFMSTLQDNVAKAIALAVSSSTAEYKKQLDTLIKNKK